MGLTRRFFTKLAHDLRDARPNTTTSSTEYAIWVHCIVITAGNLALQNAMFNYEKFYEACGVDPSFMGRRLAAADL